jgi:hypothetical protein
MRQTKPFLPSAHPAALVFVHRARPFRAAFQRKAEAGSSHVCSICVVATILFVAVDYLEPNRRYALAFKFLPRLFGAIARRDALTAVRLRHNERALSAK